MYYKRELRIEGYRSLRVFAWAFGCSLAGRCVVLQGVNIVHIVINKDHGGIVSEAIELMAASVRALGFKVEVSQNTFYQKSLNIVVGAAAYLSRQNMDDMRKLSPAYVIWQLEPLDEEGGFLRKYPLYAELMKGAVDLWEYSEGNVEYLKQMGFKGGRYIPLGYARSLERIVPVREEFDVLFYGAVNERRRAFLTELEGRGLKVCTLFGAYGQMRDGVIGRSRIVLNVHQFETQRLEQVRISYLLNNRRFVISERSEENPYGDGVVYSDYERLTDTCVKYLRAGMEGERARVAGVGYEILKKLPMSACLKEALEKIEGLEWPGRS